MYVCIGVCIHVCLHVCKYCLCVCVCARVCVSEYQRLTSLQEQPPIIPTLLKPYVHLLESVDPLCIWTLSKMLLHWQLRYKSVDSIVAATTGKTCLAMTK